MTSINLVRSELRKLTSTRMPLAFVAVLVVLAVINGIAVAVGTDMDGSKTFISTAADQQSLMAFAANALMVTGLFGAIAAAREYAHNTVIATYLAAPRRSQAVRAQLAAVGPVERSWAWSALSLTILAVAVSLPLTDFGFLVSVGRCRPDRGRIRLWAGACGAVLGAGIGTVVRNTGGAVTGAVLVLVMAPPLIVQLASDAGPWVPGTLANVVSGVTDETTVVAAGVALASGPSSRR